MLSNQQNLSISCLKTTIFNMFSFFRNLVAAGSRREGGWQACLSWALHPDIDLELFLFTLQLCREIFYSAVKCVDMQPRREKEQQWEKTSFECLNWLYANLQLAHRPGSVAAIEAPRQLNHWTLSVVVKPAGEWKRSQAMKEVTKGT